MKDKDVDEMGESELKKELKNLYKKLNDIDEEAMEDINFEGKMIIKKKNEDGEVVEERETGI